MSRRRVRKSVVRGGIRGEISGEIIGVLTSAIFIFLSLSFISYSSTDNSWFYFSSKSLPVSNWCGVVGAHIASLSFFLFGGASYLLLFALVFAAFSLFRFTRLNENWWRLASLPCLVVVGATLFNIHKINFFFPDSGGFIGRVVGSFLTVVFGKTGVLIFLYASVWVGVLILANISFAQFFLSIGTVILFAGAFLGKGLAWSFSAGFSFLRRSMASLFRAISLFLVTHVFRKKKKDYKVIFSQDKKEEDIQPEDIIFDELRELAGNKKIIEEKVFTAAQEEEVFSEEKDFSPKVEYSLPDFSEFQKIETCSDDKEKFEAECRDRGKLLEEKLLHFGIKGKVTAIRPGPVITLFEYQPEIDSKISKIISLEDDLAMALQAISIRIVAPIPGRNVVGFEISNQHRSDVFLSQILSSKEAKDFDGSLPLAFGVDIVGNPAIYDLMKMPHVLVAGSTGSGKSVGLNSMLVSLLCRLSPDELKVILIDPKRLEFAPYADIPHLLFPIVTNPRKAIPVLKWVVQEMEDRYDIMARVGARNIVDYQEIYDKKNAADKEEMHKMPFIVLIIDELADLMMVAGKDVEISIARTAQMARAAGIHMIIATQRPSVDVLTGVIKVNFPARIAFRVSSKIDSRTIIDSQGAEKLLGRGDMLFLNSGSSSVQRVHGAYLSSSDIARFTGHLRSQGKVDYLDINEALRKNTNLSTDVIEDELYTQVRDFLKTVESISISSLQRRYRIGFNRSARIIEKLEADGLVAPAQGGKVRKVLHE